MIHVYKSGRNIGKRRTNFIKLILYYLVWVLNLSLRVPIVACLNETALFCSCSLTSSQGLH